ncbi:hypothetical protein C2G38_2053744 [Gigaspora rosea]|uniref:Uncharacterized protein n=1 Tax=Gigaspora rosea TaxID=44941 RepID=A0A397W8Q2_9GLOM|nr:hypothetical protein C2G38_2053744 [Gigaspora rosea]
MGYDDGSWGYSGYSGKFFCCSDNGSIAFRNLKGTLYPCVALYSQCVAIEANFGSRKFKYTGNAE